MTTDHSARPRRAAAALGLALALGLAGCEGYQPKEFTSNDDCRDCPPGLFSGEDGALTLYGGEDGGVLGGLVQPASTRADRAVSEAEAAARLREAERRAEEAERRAAAAEARARRLERDRRRQSRPYDPGEALPGYEVQLSPDLGTYFQ